MGLDAADLGRDTLKLDKILEVLLRGLSRATIFVCPGHRADVEDLSLIYATRKPGTHAIAAVLVCTPTSPLDTIHLIDIFVGVANVTVCFVGSRGCGGVGVWLLLLSFFGM